jgi:hypothetical protein
MSDARSLMTWPRRIAERLQGIFMVALFLAASGFHSALAEQPAAVTESRRASAGVSGGTEQPEAPDEDASSPEEAALLSIYYHALKERGELPAPDKEKWPPMLLDRAAGILAKDSSPESVSRLRRAVAVLVGSSTIAVKAKEWQPVEFRDALLTLVKPETLDNISRVWFTELREPVKPVGVPREEAPSLRDRSLTPEPPPPSPRAAKVSKKGQAQQQSISQEQAALNALNAPGSGYPASCCACLTDYHIESQTETSAAMAWFRINVWRSQPEVSRAFDPRCWSSCNPEFFRKTQMATDCSASIPSQTSPAPNTCGKDDLDGKLFEKVQFDSACTNKPALRFKNKLWIVTQLDTASGNYHVDYGLCRSIRSKLPCASEHNGGIAVDCGYTATDASPVGSYVQGLKRLKFSDPALANWTAVGLRAMVDGIVEKGVCCGASAPAQGCESCPGPIVQEDVTAECKESPGR